MEKPRRSDSSRRRARGRRGELLERLGDEWAVGLEGRPGASAGGAEVLSGLGWGTGLSGAASRKPTASSSTSDLSCGQGTATERPQAGQRTFRPAISSLTRSDRPQSQLTWIGMPPLPHGEPAGDIFDAANQVSRGFVATSGPGKIVTMPAFAEPQHLATHQTFARLLQPKVTSGLWSCQGLGDLMGQALLIVQW